MRVEGVRVGEWRGCRSGGVRMIKSGGGAGGESEVRVVGSFRTDFNFSYLFRQKEENVKIWYVDIQSLVFLCSNSLYSLVNNSLHSVIPCNLVSNSL